MAAKTVGQILEIARKFHDDLSKFYEEMEQRAEKERVKMVLEYLGRHEKKLDQCLASYAEDAAHRIMDTWVKYTPDTETSEAIAAINLEPDMSVEDVIMSARQLDEYLIRIYRSMAEQACSEDVKQVFTELLELEMKEEHQMVRDSIEVEDL